MPNYNKHGNALCIVLLEASLGFPSSLSKWDGSTGNIIFLNCLSDESGDNMAKPTIKTTRTNDGQIYANDISEITGETNAKLYKQDMVTNTFMWKAAKDQIAAGLKCVEIYNLGYKEGKWQETIKLGEVMPQRNSVVGQDAPLEYKFVSTPQQSTFTISSTNITAIKAVTGYPGNIHCAGPHTILANEPEILVYT